MEGGLHEEVGHPIAEKSHRTDYAHSYGALGNHGSLHGPNTGAGPNSYTGNANSDTGAHADPDGEPNGRAHRDDGQYSCP